MVRPTTRILSPLQLVVEYGKFYQRAVATGVTHQLFFFSKDIHECERLLIFGGAVYRIKGGFSWICGKKKHLIALYKLIEASEPNTHDMKLFVEWAKEQVV